MKYLVRVLKDHIKTDWNIGIYSYTFLFIALLTFMNYKFNLEGDFMSPHRNTFKGVVVFSCLNFVSYYFICIPILLYRKKNDVLKSFRFWFLSAVVLVLIGIDRGTSFHKLWFENLPYFEKSYLNKVIGNLEGLFIYLLPFLLIWLFYSGRGKNIFGLSFKNSRSGTFFILIAFTIPLVIWASFQADFQHTYPRFKFWRFHEIFGFSKGLMAVIYEIAYGVDFVFVEWVFRGVLVILMSSVMGKDAILPMASVYVALHFGKPLAETISSFFGGYILGVFALNLRSIAGGVIVHLGLAYLMEIAAIIQHMVLVRN